MEVLRADLADRADVQLVVDRLSDPERPIDVLVNNAGFGVHWPLVSDEVEAWDRAYEVMVRSVLVLAGAAARSMKTARRRHHHQRLERGRIHHDGRVLVDQGLGDLLHARASRTS